MKLNNIEIMLAADEADWQRVANIIAAEFNNYELREAVLRPMTIVASKTQRMTEFQLRYRNNIFAWRDRDGFAKHLYSIFYEKPILVVWHRLASEDA